MKDSFKNLQELIHTFKDESVCREYLEQQCWNGKPVCPHCGNDEKIYKLNDGKTYKCGKKECYKKFTVTVGTIFENSKIKLSTWFAAMYLVTSSKKGVSSLQLGRQLGLTQKTAWFVIHRIREMLIVKQPDLITGVFEADETFIGGKNKNRHADKKVYESQGRSVKDKTPVFGMVERHGNVQTRVVTDTKATTLKPVIAELVKQGSIVITDEWLGYNTVKKDYAHVVINHTSGEYVRGAFHTNTIEGFWSLLKRGIYGIYHYASPKHLHRYCNEFSYRYNTRKNIDSERFSNTLANVSNARITYKKLIAK